MSIQVVMSIVVNGVEKSTAQWGVTEDLEITVTNKGMSTALITTMEKFDAGATQWGFSNHVTSLALSHCIIWQNRNYDNVANTFSGGSILFQGWFDDPKRVNQAGKEHVQYEVHGIWWLMQRNNFKQYRYQTVANSNVVSATQVGPQINITVTPGLPGLTTGSVIYAPNIPGVGVAVVVSATSTSNFRVTGTLSAGTPAGFVALLAKIIVPEVYLGEAVDLINGGTSLQDSGAQCVEILNWMNETYNPTKRGATGGRDNTQDILIVGTIDPKTNLPITRQNSPKCSTAIEQCLRWNSDAIIYEDFSTTPVTVNIRTLAAWNYGTNPPTFLNYQNLPETVINITATQEREVVTQGTLSRALPGVMIYYRQTDVINGAEFPIVILDIADAFGTAQYINGVLQPGGTGTPQVTDWYPEVDCHFVDLLGSSVTTVSATVLATAISALTGGGSGAVAWWQANDQTVGDPSVDPASISVASVTILDDSGNPINTTTYFNQLLSVLPDWVSGTVIRAHVSAALTFNKYTDNTHTFPDASAKNRVHKKDINLINIGSGPYSATTSSSAAEPVPTNVAASVYRSASATQYAGRITFTGQQVAGVSLGTRLTLIGPTQTFTSLLVQQIRYRPQTQEMEVTYGPCSPLDVDQWVELARATQRLTTYNLPSGRGTGGGSSGTSVDTGGTGGLADTTHGPGGHSLMGTVYPR